MMPIARYRSKPAFVEAVQFDPCGEHRTQLPAGVTGIPSPGADNWAYEGCRFYVTTMQAQQVPIKADEWVITEEDGVHHYPCHPDVFRRRWELDKGDEPGYRQGDFEIRHP